MAGATSAVLLAAGAAWRVTGFGPAGRRLLAAAVLGDEDDQVIAGMLLVRAGDRSVRLVETALSGGARAPVLVDVLASIGTPAARSVLARTASDGPDVVAGPAAAALRALDDQPPK